MKEDYRDSEFIRFEIPNRSSYRTLKSLIKKAGFKKERQGHILPKELGEDYYINNCNVPAPVGFLGKDFFNVQYLNIESLNQYTNKLIEIAESI